MATIVYDKLCVFRNTLQRHAQIQRSDGQFDGDRRSRRHPRVRRRIIVHIQGKCTPITIILLNLYPKNRTGFIFKPLNL